MKTKWIAYLLLIQVEISLFYVSCLSVVGLTRIYVKPCVRSSLNVCRVRTQQWNKLRTTRGHRWLHL